MAASAIQIEANRANAQKSTGPITADGKAASSRNASVHGLNSQELFLLPGEEEIYCAFESDLIADYQPQGAAESILFKALLHAAWNARRCRLLDAILRIEANSQGIADPLLDETMGPKAERVARYARSTERSHSTALRDLRKLQTERAFREEPTNEADPDAHSVAADTQTIAGESIRRANVELRNTNLLLRNRFGARMPALVFNDDGTYSAHLSDGKQVDLTVGKIGFLDLRK